MASSTTVGRPPRLLPSADGRRTAIREFLAFDAGLRTRLLRADPGAWPVITREAVDTQGQSFTASIHSVLEQGRITEAVAARALKEIG